MLLEKIKNKYYKNIGYGQLLAIGFVFLVLFWALILTTPIANKDHTWNSFFSSLFTATSSTCVTGLVIYDTYSHYTLFGQLVILLSIQIGGLGFMIPIAMISIIFRKSLSMHNKNMLRQATGYFRYSGLAKMVKRIIVGTFTIEGIGAILLSFAFIPEFGLARGIYFSIFHSISSFCNAGFDLMGYKGIDYASLSSYAYNPYVLIVLSLLIILGGIGFLIWDDVATFKYRFNKYSFHSKLVISTSLILVVLGTVLYMIFEYNNPETIGNMPFGYKLLNSYFQSVTTRTAGFNVLDQSKLTISSYVTTLVFMLIGGGPCSTAGGFKVTTIAILVLNALAAARQKKEVTVYNKSISDNTVKQASAIVTIYLMLVITVLCIIMPSLRDLGFDLRSGAYVVCSAIGTVGLAHDVTAMMSTITLVCLIILMYIGRIGGLTIAMFLNETTIDTPVRRPEGKVLVG